jgi:hypothetical protein
MATIGMDREEHNRHGGGGNEAALTQGGESDLCHLLNGIIMLAADDGSHPWRCGVAGYHHLDLIDV